MTQSPRLRTPRNPRKANYPQLWAFVLLLVLVVLLGVALTIRPAIIRWSHLRHLTDTDLAKRELALNYVVRFGRTDPAVIRGAVDRLGVGDEKNFLQIVNAIDHAGQWRRPPVSDGPWLRWIGELESSQEKTARVLAAHYLAEMPDLIDRYPLTHQGGNDSPVINALNRLFYDQDADVRYAALLAAAELDGKVDGLSTQTLSLLRRAADDKDPEIARHAWIFLGLSPNHQFYTPPDWQAAQPAVAEATLWAISRLHPDDPSPAIVAVNDPKLPALVRGMAIYALHDSHTPKSQEALSQVLQHAHDPGITDDEQIFLARAVLSVETVPASLTQWTTTPSRMLPVVAAACYRTGRRLGLTTQPSTQPATHPARDTRQDLVDLAALEGTRPGSSGGLDYPIEHDMPDMLRLAAVAASSHPKPDVLRPLFDSEESTMRDLACVVAADRFTKDQNSKLVDSLLHDLDDDAKVAGAVLAGLTGVQGDLLAQKMKDENVWAVKSMMKAGLWMQGKMPEMVRAAPELLDRSDIPKSTLLLVLLHQKNPAGLDFLFNPRGEPPLDLVTLLDEKRWWRVLFRFLPSPGGASGGPPFWVWADPELERFQIDVLRDWYLVNREKLYPH